MKKTDYTVTQKLMKKKEKKTKNTVTQKLIKKKKK